MSGKRVALFATCINDLMFPGTPQATVELLEKLGCEVVFPRAQTCCGQMHTNTGYFDKALGSVKTFVEAFTDYEYIVGPSGSCVGAVRHQHEMVAEECGDHGLAMAAAAVTARTYDITEFIVDVLGLNDVGAYFPHKVTYHPTCHSARIAKIGSRPYDLLKAVKGLELLDLDDAEDCCGFGGTFSLKNPDVSIAMASTKARHVVNSGAEYLVAADNACLMNIGGVLHRVKSKIQPIHLVEILNTTEGVAA